MVNAWRKPIVALVLFGVAFGYLEAAVVSYLRVLHESARQRFYPNRAPERQPDDLFPLLTLEQVRTSGESQTLAIEVGREAATMLMLAAVALAATSDLGRWGAAFVIAFGVWDATFYLFLKLLLGWPASLLTWDILFLIPVPWVAPVLAPVLVSAAMIAGGVALPAGYSARPVARGRNSAGRPGDRCFVHGRLPEHHGRRAAASIPLERLRLGHGDRDRELRARRAQRARAAAATGCRRYYQVTRSAAANTTSDCTSRTVDAIGATVTVARRPIGLRPPEAV